MGDHGFFSIITAFLLVSFCSAQLLNVEKSVDENLQKQIMIFSKLRGLLGPTSLLSSGHSPPPPTPPLRPLIHCHSRPSSHNHNTSIPEAREVKKKKKKKKKKGEGTNRRVLIALLVSAGITSSLCAVGILWGCQKFRKTRKNLVGTLLVHCIEGSKDHSSQKSVEKVSFQPRLVTLQLSETTFLKQDLETANAISNQTTSEKSEEEEEEQQVGTGEIISVHHQNIEPHNCNSDHHSSDDESFHSICDSFSSDNIRFSNASASSLCEASEIISQDDSKQSQASVPLTIINSNSESCSSSTKLPPPPPPPLPRGITNSVKAPPPPAPLAKDGTLLPKLKPLHWDKVKAAPECSTVWDKLKASSFE